MTSHSFVDESKASAYMLVAAFIRPAHLTDTRRAVAAMIMPRQRRIHFHNERPDRRSQIINRMIEMPVEAAIYETGRVKEKAARDNCLSLLVRDCIERDVRRLVIEQDDSHAETDRRILQHAIRSANATDRLCYELLRGDQEPLLSIPDAIAWCWARGGHRRVKAKQLVKEVHRV